MLAVEALTVSFGAVAALDGVDLGIAHGEAVGLFGPNGSGKSTLFNCISGLVRPVQGRIDLQGKLLSRRPPHEIARLGVARTFQTPRFFRRLSALDNVRPFTPTGASAGPDLELARLMLSWVGLEGRADDLVDELSLYDQRRLELARALAPGPRLVLLDEPTSGLGPDETRGMASLVRRLIVPTTAMILVEHKIDLIRELCPRAVMLDNGRKIADGATAEVMASPEVRRAYLGGAA